MIPLSEVKKEWMNNPEFKSNYEKIDAEISLQEALIKARLKARMSQAEVAKRMNVAQSVVARLETGRRFKPSFQTIRRYADAVNAHIKLEFISKEEAQH